MTIVALHFCPRLTNRCLCHVTISYTMAPLVQLFRSRSSNTGTGWKNEKHKCILTVESQSEPLWLDISETTLIDGSKSGSWSRTKICLCAFRQKICSALSVETNSGSLYLGHMCPVWIHQWQTILGLIFSFLKVLTLRLRRRAFKQPLYANARRSLKFCFTRFCKVILSLENQCKVIFPALELHQLHKYSRSDGMSKNIDFAVSGDAVVLEGWAWNSQKMSLIHLELWG